MLSVETNPKAASFDKVAVVSLTATKSCHFRGDCIIQHTHN